MKNANKNKMHITGLWTHFGYADEFDVSEYNVERKAWLDIVSTLIDEGYHFDMIHAQNSASYYREHGVLEKWIKANRSLLLPLNFVANSEVSKGISAASCGSSGPLCSTNETILLIFRTLYIV